MRSLALALVAVATLFAVLAGLAGPRTARHGLGVVDDVAAGTTEPRTLADGTPVYVHRDGDERIVLDAISPRSYLLVWCADAPGFIEPGSAFSFDARGRYAFGGFPHGMFRYDAQMSDGRVVVTAPRQPAPRHEAGVIPARPPGPDELTCFESEGDAGGLYHPVADDPIDLTQLQFDGGWHAVRGFLDFTRHAPRLCASASVVADRCPADGPDVVPVASSYGQRSPVVDEMPPGRFDGEFVVRAGPARVVHDVAIVQRLHSRSDVNRTPAYSTRYLPDEDATDAGSLPRRTYVVGEVEEFVRTPDGFRIEFLSAILTEAAIGDQIPTSGGQPASESWAVSENLDLVGVFDETGADWLISPQQLADRVSGERLVVAGQVGEQGSADEVVALHILRRQR